MSCGPFPKPHLIMIAVKKTGARRQKGQVAVPATSGTKDTPPAASSSQSVPEVRVMRLRT